MKQFAYSFLLFLLCAPSLFAQKGDLVAKSSDKGLYLEHKVVPKESFFAVGRTYNVSPKFLAAYNKLDINKGLFVDQKIRIPLTDTNFSQQVNSGTPVYYKTGDKENLAAVSAKHQKVSLARLKMWNNLSGDEVKEGTKLIIGFLQSKSLPAVTIENKPVKEEPVAKVEEKPVIKEEKPVVKEEVKPIEEKVEEKPVVKEIEKPIEEKVAGKTVISEQGYFKSHFDQQIRQSPVTKNETVVGGIFKTLTGWQDGKYYILVDKIPAGTIIKVTNPSNNKVIFAKVLGDMSGIRQNEGLNFRISNAAAFMLDITEQDKFIVKLNY